MRVLLVFALLTLFSQVFSQELLGAGASFPAPLVTAMADQYRELTGVVVNYQSIGSGGGIRQFTEETIMFGMTEAFIRDENLPESPIFHMPLTLGDVVVTYNIPGVDVGLVFDGELISDIFLGNVSNWGDDRVLALNPGVRIPALPITVVHRSDGSGTTAIFTDYLSKVSPEWAERVGFGTSVDWPAGLGGNGNEGVAGVVQNTPGSIGYNSLVYAVLNDIAYGYVVNASGNVIAPSLEATTLSAQTEINPDTRVSITNTDSEFGYPMTGFSWVLLYQELSDNDAIQTREQAVALVDFIEWAITYGQSLSETLSFSRIPDSVLELNMNMLRQVTWQGEPLFQ